MLRISYIVVILLTGWVLFLPVQRCAGQGLLPSTKPSAIRSLKPMLNSIFGIRRPKKSTDVTVATSAEQERAVPENEMVEKASYYQGASPRTYSTPSPNLVAPADFFNGPAQINEPSPLDQPEMPPYLGPSRAGQHSLERAPTLNDGQLVTDADQNFNFSDGSNWGNRANPHHGNEGFATQIQHAPSQSSHDSYSASGYSEMQSGASTFNSAISGEYRVTPNRQTYPVSPTGMEFRRPPQTASELMIQYKDQNFTYRDDIRRMQHQLKELQLTLDEETKQQTELEETLATANLEIGALRELVAKLKVNVRTLREEKIVIQRDADKALRNIEANLDAALMNSLTTALDADRQ
jgi:hypothetical protein